MVLRPPSRQPECQQMRLLIHLDSQRARKIKAAFPTAADTGSIIRTGSRLGRISCSGLSSTVH